jgi:biopolymer transport protein TolR
MRSRRRLKNEINVVPYIDVMLVLLVIFMVAAPMMQTGTVELPTTGAAGVTPDNPFRIEVDKNGALSITDASGSRPVSRDELKTILMDEQEKDPEIAILVAGDKAASYESVLNALDDIKALNFQHARVGLETSRQ